MTSIEEADPALDDAVWALIHELNQHISATGESIEGNVCYWNDTPAETYRVEKPTSDYDHMCKRANLATMARRHRSMVEIGLNGGHSALICLAANPYLHLFSVDIVGHKYTEVAARFLKTKFGRRFHFYTGDSRDVMPRLAVEQPNLRFDLMHVDGGHGVALARTDISNCLRMATVDADLIFDDIQAPELSAVLEEFIRMGYLAPLPERGNIFSNQLHDILRVQIAG